MRRCFVRNERRGRKRKGEGREEEESKRERHDKLERKKETTILESSDPFALAKVDGQRKGEGKKGEKK